MTGPKSRLVNANGIQHHVLEWGNPEARPLIMLQGIGLCAQVWNWTARRLSYDYRVQSIDKSSASTTWLWYAGRRG